MTIDIDMMFTHHPPKNNTVAQKHEFVRSELKAVAKKFERELPDSREKTLAIGALQQAMMYANSAIAQHQ